MFITFEGIDGCGKSTQAALLAEALGRDRVRLFREPGGTAAAERIREILIDPEVPLDPLAELMLFSAARADLVAGEIRPALEDGLVVICDRFTDSTLAYQGVARGLGSGGVKAIAEMVTGGLRPDLTIYLKVDPETARSRSTGEDRFEANGIGFQVVVAAAYDQIAADDPDRVWTLDAEGRTPETIHREILNRVGEFIELT